MTTRDLAPLAPLDGSAALSPTSSRASVQLLEEAAALSRYIVGHDASREVLQRYVDAHAYLDVGGEGRGELAVLHFALAHRWALPGLDAAVALLRPQAALHRKALLMTALLEATPEHAELFLPRPAGWPALIWLGVRLGLRTVVDLVIGIPLLLLLERRS